MVIETPTASLTLLTAGLVRAAAVLRCDVSGRGVTRRGVESSSAGEGVAVQMDLAPPSGGLATLMLSPREAETMAHALLRALDRSCR